MEGVKGSPGPRGRDGERGDPGLPGGRGMYMGHSIRQVVISLIHINMSTTLVSC